MKVLSCLCGVTFAPHRDFWFVCHVENDGLANDVYAQIGMIMLIGLLGKNAVLIVEFAVQRHNEGVPVLKAAIEGAKMRFRPILMTSFAFIAGLIPLVIAHGAGAVGNKTIGSSAMGGMLLGTMIGVFVIPGLYYTFGKMIEGKNLLQNESHSSLSEAFVESQQTNASLVKKISKLSVLLKAAQRKKRTMENNKVIIRISICLAILAGLWSCNTPKIAFKETKPHCQSNMPR
jgi:HAE1 family hydrophobic/amphiphilic exporter-1